MRKILLTASLFALSLVGAQTTNVYNWGFDAAFGSDWVITNQSSPAGASVWSKSSFTLPLTAAIFGSGDVNTLPVGQAGGANSFALVNFNSTTGSGTISNWLITPSVNVKDGDIVSFYTRKGTDGTTDYPDRLELRYSTAATTVNPSGGSSGLGTFTNVGVTVNPNLAANFTYPKVWTKYQFTVSGVGATAIPVKFAFRYFVTSGGPSGTNSDIIGIDTFSVDRSNLGTAESSTHKNLLSIYPNPASDVLNIKSATIVNNVSITDLSGKVIKANVSNNQVDVRNLPVGTYILKAETKDGFFTEKFIKK